MSFDFGAENAAAIVERRRKLDAWRTKPNRIAGGPAHLFEGVRRELAQLNDLIELVKKGRKEHFAGIAARLRLLVATGKPVPALQSAAATLDMPLTLYTVANPRLAMPEDLRKLIITGLYNEASATPDTFARNPIDLDIWLGLTGADVGAAVLTNADLIKIVGDTMGAHFDHDIVAEVPSLGIVTSGIGNVPLTGLEMFLLKTAEASTKLCEQVLAARSGS